MGTKDQIGLEASGIVRRVGAYVTRIIPGQRVIVVGTGIFCSVSIISQRAYIEIPPEITLEEAGGIVSIFATAQYVLVFLAQVKRDQVDHLQRLKNTFQIL